jgi:TetR/AcrR family transcriptional regulator, transcriptional repressor for nem operon
MSKREAIVQAAKDLIWEEGYEAMSPRDVMERSGAGQGSLYHHFRGKRDLAEQALWEVNDEMRGIADRVFGHPERTPLQRIGRFFDVLSRDPLKGCRVGRVAVESSIEDDILRAPISAWFEYAERKVADALAEAQAAGQVRAGVDPRDLAFTLVALVQGGYLLARAHRDPAAMHRALAGAMTLLESSTERES